jgi:uncharacterized protein
LESQDISKPTAINNVLLDLNSDFKTNETKIKNRKVVSVLADAFIQTNNWDNKLYQPINKEKKIVQLVLIPYFSWGNRLKNEMTVWLSH